MTHLIKIKPSRTSDKYSIIIPAAGVGYRMKHFGPKCLIKIHDETILQRLLKIVHNTFSHYELILVTGYSSDKIMNSTPEYVVNVENELYEQTNVSRSIAIGLRASTTNRILILYGDLVFGPQVIQQNYDNQSLILINRSQISKSDEVGCVINNEKIENFQFDLTEKWSQIAYITGKELELMKKICYNRNNDKLFGFEVMNKIIDGGGKLIPCYHSENLIDVDQAKDVDVAKEYVR